MEIIIVSEHTLRQYIAAGAVFGKDGCWWFSSKKLIVNTDIPNGIKLPIAKIGTKITIENNTSDIVEVG